MKCSRLIGANDLSKASHARTAATPMDNTDFMPAWRGKMAEHYTHAALCEAAGLPVRRKAPKHGLTVV